MTTKRNVYKYKGFTRLMENKTKTALALTAAGLILIPTISEAVTAITRYVNDSSPQDTTKSWRQGLPGETYGSPNEQGKIYLPFHGGWTPWPHMGDTISNETWNGNNRVFGKVIINDDVSKGLELFYDNQSDTLLEHAPNVRKLIDETGLTDPILAISYKNNNPALQCTTALDTALNGHFFHAYPIGALDIEPGDSITTEFTKGSTIIPVTFEVDTALGQAQLVADTIKFQSTGIKENLENKLHESLIIKPNPATNYLTFGKNIEGFLYDASGKKVLSINSDRLDLRKADISSGIYFVVPDKYKIQKPKKVTIIR